MKDLSKKSGVYVGESARSIFERAGEHHADMINKNEDSHMLKHWLSSHPEAEEPPNFKIKVVGSFSDSLTRQVAEAVRIDLRGGGVLNSKSEYSRCRIPRLVIDHDEWSKMKKKEKDELEKKNEVTEIVTILENGEEIRDVRAEELEIDLQERRQPKRKAEIEEKPAKKKRKYDLLDNWGIDEEDSNDVKEDNILVNWLAEAAHEPSVDSDITVGNNPVTVTARADIDAGVRQKKMRQLEINFKRKFEDEWLNKEVEKVDKFENTGANQTNR